MTIYVPDLFEPKRKRSGYTRIREEYLRINHGIDPAILADALGVTERFVISYQRKLGIRALTANRRIKSCHE